MPKPLSRRSALRQAATGAAALAVTANFSPALAADPTPVMQLKGNINHSVCRWCYSKTPLDDLCQAGKDMGLVAIDLLNPDEFATVKKYGLVCSMVFNPTVDGLGGITKAWNRLEHHDKLVPAYEQRLRQTADAGYPRVICFSGNREGLADEQGLANCAAGLQRILPLAEKLNITVCMELLKPRFAFLHNPL